MARRQPAVAGRGGAAWMLQQRAARAVLTGPAKQKAGAWARRGPHLAEQALGAAERLGRVLGVAHFHARQRQAHTVPLHPGPAAGRKRDERVLPQRERARQGNTVATGRDLPGRTRAQACARARREHQRQQRGRAHRAQLQDGAIPVALVCVVVACRRQRGGGGARLSWAARLGGAPREQAAGLAAGELRAAPCPTARMAPPRCQPGG